jgi:hypothetical protein
VSLPPKMWILPLLAFVSQFRLVSSHAYLITPIPRVPEADQPPRNSARFTFGLKRTAGTPFNLAAARVITDPSAVQTGCGPTDELDLQAINGGQATNIQTATPGPGYLVTNYTAGESLTVQWRLSIPHMADNTNLGVRVAIIYPPAVESGERRMEVLAGAPSDGLTVTPGAPAQVAADAGPASTGIEVKSVEVRIPTTPCERCVLQWLWVAQMDGGYYLDCADISITEPGAPTQMPTPTPTEAPFEVSSDDLVISLKGHTQEGVSSDSIRILKETLEEEFGLNSREENVIRSSEIRDQVHVGGITTIRIRVEFFEKDSDQVGEHVAVLMSDQGKYIFNLQVYTHTALRSLRSLHSLHSLHSLQSLYTSSPAGIYAYCTVLHCTALYCTVLHCTALYSLHSLHSLYSLYSLHSLHSLLSLHSLHSLHSLYSLYSLHSLHSLYASSTYSSYTHCTALYSLYTSSPTARTPTVLHCTHYIHLQPTARAKRIPEGHRLKQHSAWCRGLQ